MNQSWKNDPRLKDLDPRKLDLLSSFASRISQMPKGQLLTAFADLNLEAQKAGLAFTDQETQLIVSILTGSHPAKGGSLTPSDFSQKNSPGRRAKIRHRNLGEGAVCAFPGCFKKSPEAPQTGTLRTFVLFSLITAAASGSLPYFPRHTRLMILPGT